jgi:hypothetical protein
MTPIEVACEPMLFARKVIGFLAPLAVTLVVFFVATTVAIGFMAQPRVRHACGGSHVEIAKLAVQKYAYEAYPQWAAKYPTHTCPSSLYELDPFMNVWHQPDPWGHEYVLTCSDGNVYVASLGEDGASGTADDIWSHR